MRLISRKIWRAFPELDRFDDKTCERYITPGKKVASNPFGWVIYLGAVCLGVVIWAVICVVAYVLIEDIDQKIWNSMLGAWIQVLAGIIGVGVIWIPCIVLLFTRDRFMWMRVKARLIGASCFQCSYCLVGLSPSTSEQGRGVRCPECGFFYAFDGGKITESDINPTLLNKH